MRPLSGCARTALPPFASARQSRGSSLPSSSQTRATASGWEPWYMYGSRWRRPSMGGSSSPSSSHMRAFGSRATTGVTSGGSKRTFPTGPLWTALAGRHECERGLGTRERHLDPAQTVAERDVDELLEAEVLGVELDRLVRIARRDHDAPDRLDAGLAACLHCSPFRSVTQIETAP